MIIMVFAQYILAPTQFCPFMCYLSASTTALINIYYSILAVNYSVKPTLTSTRTLHQNSEPNTVPQQGSRGLRYAVTSAGFPSWNIEY